MQAELGTPVAEVCRKMGVSEATFFRWEQRYGGLGPSELRKLRQLEEENTKLKRLVADLSLDKAMLQDVLAKKRAFIYICDLGEDLAEDHQRRHAESRKRPAEQRPEVRLTGPHRVVRGEC